MSQFLASREAFILAIVALSLALMIVGYVIVAPGPVRIPLDRRRPSGAPGPNALAQTTTKVTNLLDRFLRQRSGSGARAAALEEAGVKMRLQDFTLMVIVSALVAGALGLVLVGPLVGLVAALVVPLVAKFWLGFKAGRRRAAFADQLDDSLQLIASSLRAGHSLLQALASVAHEAEEPTAEEFARIINENRVGRELGAALDQAGVRMASEDFVWVTQAIAINREVGGNLAEVLDGVGRTIRERNQLRRQVKALSAEGKLSAYVLMALPIGITGFLSYSNPEYLSKFTEGIIGYSLIGAAALLFIVGGLWMRKVVSIKF